MTKLPIEGGNDPRAPDRAMRHAPPGGPPIVTARGFAGNPVGCTRENGVVQIRVSSVAYETALRYDRHFTDSWIDFGFPHLDGLP